MTNWASLSISQNSHNSLGGLGFGRVRNERKRTANEMTHNKYYILPNVKIVIRPRSLINLPMDVMEQMPQSLFALIIFCD